MHLQVRLQHGQQVKVALLITEYRQEHHQRNMVLHVPTGRVQRIVQLLLIIQATEVVRRRAAILRQAVLPVHQAAVVIVRLRAVPTQLHRIRRLRAAVREVVVRVVRAAQDRQGAAAEDKCNFSIINKADVSL